MSTDIVTKIAAFVLMLAGAGMLIWRLKKVNEFDRAANSGNLRFVMIMACVGFALLLYTWILLW